MDMDIIVPWARQRLKQWSWLVTRPSSPNYAPLDLQPGNPLKYTYPLAVIGKRVKKAVSEKCSPILRKKVLYESTQASLMPFPIEPTRNKPGWPSTSIAHRQWASSQTAATTTIITSCTKVWSLLRSEKKAFITVWIPAWLGWQITPVADRTLCDLV